MAIERLKCFISYSTKDKKLAGALKDCLTEYGLDVFLAHEDIAPSAAWVQTILAELKAADVFLPLLTENFPGSKFTDQETGLAVAGDKLTIPLKVHIDPYGFIASIQALKVDPSKATAACAKIARTIGKNPELRGKFLDGLIEMFADSYNFKKAGEYASELNELDGYTPLQVRRVLVATIENPQINESWAAQKELRKFIEKYGNSVDRELVKQAKKAINP